ncbi:TlpA family protein disulfide reductase [Verminephrobacter aporrectodeae]|uniref:TlpA family protein disulfide reductase n=1 Tax=Verminephrobacter aporrectodeae TaxID=1110389 RepID=UPI002243E72B|nr:TlpA disulfide reductase family protein [Verminephrobacter aporrectodeae]MCW8174097.1 TlpA family protein disulfide reductase [Verminephrobacter aporrectodeae subsp. tuberculatae]MCW8197945.1 TlpA family protein disulfide reductase [Verminephrobacter aporrectodeae subsp. tuberculatae]MCW8201618.1 TlpA family protein disulfide reductase [Verminephrobacter aporrectodeae subsp. tuberculatae]
MTRRAEIPEPVPAASNPPSPVRRRLLYAGVAGAAALGGGGLAWWRLQPQAPDSGAQQALWAMEFEQPGGAVVALKSFAGRPLLLNFWATWCPPCVAELPMLDAFYRAHSAQGWQVLGLAVDQPPAVRKFLQHRPLAFPVGLAGAGGVDLGRSLGNLTGGLPFTVVLGGDGRVRHRRMGPLSARDLQLWSSLR